MKPTPPPKSVSTSDLQQAASPSAGRAAKALPLPPGVTPPMSNNSNTVPQHVDEHTDVATTTTKPTPAKVATSPSALPPIPGTSAQPLYPPAPPPRTPPTSSPAQAQPDVQPPNPPPKPGTAPAKDEDECVHFYGLCNTMFRRRGRSGIRPPTLQIGPHEDIQALIQQNFEKAKSSGKKFITLK